MAQELQHVETTSKRGAFYRLWSQDGALAGARFDAAFDGNTDFTSRDLYAGNDADPVPADVNLASPALSANDADTAANELRTHIILTGSAVEGDEGMFSLGALLASGTATDQGDRFVDSAVEDISKVRSDVASLLALDSSTLDLDTILENQWSKVEVALDSVFNTDSDHGTPADRTSAVRQTAPREEDILDEIDDILDALASQDSFVAATAADGGGVFETQELGSGTAADTFNRVMWTASATMGATGATRYGTAVRKETDNARSGLSTAVVGAFSYSTMSETTRTSQAAAVSLTGIASYSGGTEAISADGTTYSGAMDLQVRFSANTVSGVVRDLLSAVGLPWQHNFADVDRIVLDDATLRRDSQWNKQDGETATVFYTADSGLLRPVQGLANRFRGILLGTGADAGTQANGVWSVNDADSANYLTGGFGVMHVGDATRPRPEGDTGGAATAKLTTTRDRSGETPPITTPTVSVGDGKLTVKVQRYGWNRPTTGDPTYGGRTSVDDGGTPDDDSDDVTSAVLATAEFDLEALAGKAAGAKTTLNGPKWVDSVKATLQAQRDQIATLQALGTRTASTRAAEAAAWQIAVDAIQYQLFGGHLPVKLAGDYAADRNLQEDALDHLGRAIDALSNTNNLFAALDPEGTGIFDYYDSDTTADGVQEGNFIRYDATIDRRWKTTGNNRALSAFLGEREYKVVASLGTTDYTRFGVWYRIGAVSAERWSTGHTSDNPHNGVKKNEGGPGSFAYSPLDPTMAGSRTNSAFPQGGTASFVGETVAIMDEDTLTGTAKVDVAWAAVQDTGGLDLVVNATDDQASNAGSMTLTLGNLADSTGDPLTFTGDITGATRPAEGFEIEEIVFRGMTIEVGLPGANSGHLIVGNEAAVTPATTPATWTYGEVTLTPSSDVRYRLSAIDLADQPGDGAASVAALFVGQGVDGPLGVIGTYTLSDTRVARVRPPNAAGVEVEEGAEIIFGGFGVDIP